MLGSWRDAPAACQRSLAAETVSLRARLQVAAGKEVGDAEWCSRHLIECTEVLDAIAVVETAAIRLEQLAKGPATLLEPEKAAKAVEAAKLASRNCFLKAHGGR
eukprot:SAG31_NODE_290_length_18324_cov_33.408889_10_plen_104_part_00